MSLFSKNILNLFSWDSNFRNKVTKTDQMGSELKPQMIGGHIISDVYHDDQSSPNGQ